MSCPGASRTNWVKVSVKELLKGDDYNVPGILFSAVAPAV
jgi:hypothetical protein